jgi:SH3 domain protein
LRFSAPLLLFLLLISAVSLAQDIRYVGGEQAIALRDGPGENYTIVYRGIPPQTRVTVARTSDDGLWAEISTENGVTGWIAAQNLVLEPPARATPAASAKPVQDATGDAGAKAANDVTAGVAAPMASAADLQTRVNSCDTEFNAVAQELHRLKQVSGKAVQLDIDNHRLVEESENLHSDVGMLQAENQRLRDRLASEDFMNGALAVLLGVIIALIVPRLVPQRRKNSGWA